MREKKAVVPGKGQPSSCRGSGATLAAMIGLPALRRLSDSDVAELVEFVKCLVATAADDAFKQGWQAATEYNTDVERLTSMPCSTGH